jgi:hypothetical protein
LRLSALSWRTRSDETFSFATALSFILSAAALSSLFAQEAHGNRSGRRSARMEAGSMDVFKLAFETTVAGLLAFLWLGVATYLLFPDFVRGLPDRIDSDAAKGFQAAIGVGVLIIAYCLGSAILPISNQFVNDEHGPLNESAIRCQVFTRQEQWLESVHDTAFPKGKNYLVAKLRPRHCSYWAPIFTDEDIAIGKRTARFGRLWIGLPVRADEAKTGQDEKALETYCDTRQTTECDEFKARKILTIFQQQEAKVLEQGTDKTEFLRQLHERIVVLRGAVFSGFVLLLIFIFAFFARVDGLFSHWVRPFFGALLAILFTIFAAFNGYHDVVSRNVFDIPILEGLLMVITIFGVYLVFKPAKTLLFRRKRYMLLTLFFTGLVYGGWMWSEILYDQIVINTYAALQSTSETQKQ